MVTESVILHHLHRLQLLQSGLLADLILSLIGIVLKMSDIGDITYITYFVSQMPEQLEKHVISHSRTGVAQVGIAVHGRSADIHPNMAFMDRLEKLLGLGQGVCQI